MTTSIMEHGLWGNLNPFMFLGHRHSLFGSRMVRAMFLLDITKARQASLRCTASARFHTQPSQCFLLQTVNSYSMASPVVSTARKLNGWSILLPDFWCRAHSGVPVNTLCPGRGGVTGKESAGGSELAHPLCYSAELEG